MSYKSILTYCDVDPETQNHVALSVNLASQFDGHLTIAAVVCEPDLSPYAFDSMSGLQLAELLEESRATATELERKTANFVSRQGIKADVIELVSSSLGLSRDFGQLARFADLVILPPLSGAVDETATEVLIEGALFDGDAAILVSPSGIESFEGERIVIGWNGERETLRAVRRAMPFLRRAKMVEIAVIDPAQSEGSPGADLALLLARHGIDPVIASIPSAGQRVSTVLRQCVLDAGADLLVMGAYGHSRFREYVIGGVTREIMRETKIPVLMAH